MQLVRVLMVVSVQMYSFSTFTVNDHARRGEVHHMVGVAVTPVVCYLAQDLAEIDLKPNSDEVSEVFTGKCVCGGQRQLVQQS